MIPNFSDPTLEPQRGEAYEAKLLEARTALDNAAQREEAANLAKAAADRAYWRRVQHEHEEAIAATAARDERIRQMIGPRDVKEILCDLIDRVAALESKQ